MFTNDSNALNNNTGQVETAGDDISEYDRNKYAESEDFKEMNFTSKLGRHMAGYLKQNLAAVTRKKQKKILQEGSNGEDYKDDALGEFKQSHFMYVSTFPMYCR